MTKIETEVKFHLADPPAVRAKLLALGACSTGRHFERNVRFEDPQRGLQRARRLLRLRRDRKSTLTFKSPAARPDPGFKQMEEIEVEVADFDTMQRILNALGFRPEQAYEKWRETLSFGDGDLACCLDCLPYGDFLEIEGPPEAIPDLAARLDLDWERRILANYLEIFELIRARHNLAFADVTFGNFAPLAVDLAACLPALERARPASPV